MPENTLQSPSKTSRFLLQSILWIALFCFATILVLLIFFNNLPYPLKEKYYMAHLSYVSFGFLLLPVGLFLGASVFYFRKYSIDNKVHTIDKLVKYSLLPIYLLQLYIFLHIYFESNNWDAGAMVGIGRAMVAGDSAYLQEISSEYLSIYQGNLFLSYIVAMLFKVNKAIGIFSPEYDIMSVVMVNALLSLATAYLVYKLLRKFVQDSRLALLGYCIALFLLAFSPWNVIPYSDALSLIFPVLLVYLALVWQQNKLIKWPVLSLIAFIGVLLKQTVAILLIAVAIIWGIALLDALLKKKKPSIKKPWQSLLAASLSVFCIFAMQSILSWQYKSVGYNIIPEKKLSFYHGVLLGQNDSSGGTWNIEDVVFANAFENAEEREQATKAAILKRIQNRGFLGQMTFTAKKLLATFNDACSLGQWRAKASFTVI